MAARSLALLTTLAALWGGSFVFMRYAVPAMGPVPLTFARVALAALVLFALAAARRKVPDLRSHWQGFAIVGIVNSALPFVLFCFAEQTIGASTAGILNATSPFFGAVAAAIWLGEPLTARKIGGMTLGLVGVALLVGLQPEALTRDTVFAIAESSAGWFGASAWPLSRSLRFADRHRGRSREGNKYGKRKFLCLDSQSRQCQRKRRP